MTQLNEITGHALCIPMTQNPVRSAVRFPMRLPLTIHTASGAYEAVTENVSANGLLFLCEYLPAVNSRIEFTMTMPAAIMGSKKDVLAHCVGRIVRHEFQGRAKKAAVVIDEYFLRA